MAGEVSEISADPTAEERVTIDRPPSKTSRYSWRITVKGDEVRRTSRRLDLSRDEALVLRDRLNEIFS